MKRPVGQRVGFLNWVWATHFCFKPNLKTWRNGDRFSQLSELGQIETAQMRTKRNKTESSLMTGICHIIPEGGWSYVAKGVTNAQHSFLVQVIIAIVVVNLIRTNWA